jgi:stringent starvation protein B
MKVAVASCALPSNTLAGLSPPARRMSSSERPSKQQAFLALLREGWTSLHLDARRPGVVVPQPLRGEPHLVLQYGHDLPIPIPDLEVDEYGVRATLSFSRAAHRTVVPWSAVYVVACDDGRGVLYSEDVPPDVTVIAARATSDLAPPDLEAEMAEAAEEIAMPAAQRLLRSVPADAVAAAADFDAAPVATPARRRRRPQLRLVK